MSVTSPITSLAGRARRTVVQLGQQGAEDNAASAAQEVALPGVIDDILDDARMRHPSAQDRTQIHKSA